LSIILGVRKMMKKIKEWLLKWLKSGNKPMLAEAVIKGGAFALGEAIKEVVKLDSNYTKQTALDAILDEYKK
jgi:hypothetical protein